MGGARPSRWLRQRTPRASEPEFRGAARMLENNNKNNVRLRDQRRTTGGSERWLCTIYAVYGPCCPSSVCLHWRNRSPAHFTYCSARRQRDLSAFLLLPLPLPPYPSPSLPLSLSLSHFPLLPTCPSPSPSPPLSPTRRITGGQQKKLKKTGALSLFPPLLPPPSPQRHEVPDSAIQHRRPYAYTAESVTALKM